MRRRSSGAKLAKMDMKHFFGRPLCKAVAVALLATLAATSALAQWQWKDASGRRVFSDTPPPPAVPDKDILKRPGQRPSQEPAAAEPSAAGGTAAPPTAVKAPPGDASVLDEKKKQLEKAEADKALAEKKAIEDKNAKIRADNCESARRSKAALDSGIRMTTNNAKGEVEFLDEAGRAAQQRKIQELIRENCR